MGDELYVDQNDLWLPNTLFGENPERGGVYRIGARLFEAALRFREGLLSEQALLRDAQAWRHTVTYSATETEALKEWGDAHIQTARRTYRGRRQDYLRRSTP